MCPNECPGLEDCWGEKFEELYIRWDKPSKACCFYFPSLTLFWSLFLLVCDKSVNVSGSLFVLRYEKEGRAKRVIKAQQLWYAIIESQTETGTPYMLYKDACNRKSNQQNLGTIKSSNLCTEIVEYTNKDEVRKTTQDEVNFFSFCAFFFSKMFSSPNPGGCV